MYITKQLLHMHTLYKLNSVTLFKVVNLDNVNSHKESIYLQSQPQCILLLLLLQRKNVTEITWWLK